MRRPDASMLHQTGSRAAAQVVAVDISAEKIASSSTNLS